MNRKTKIWGAVAVTIITTALFIFWVNSKDVAVLSPEGQIAADQKDLIIKATLLMLIVVVPVFVLTFAFAWRYRESNKSAKYSPRLSGNWLAESIWWAIPLAIIVLLSLMIWESSHRLDPFKPLEHSKKPVTVQVVALPWKWLFIYPEERVASVNYVRFPEKTPVNFEITADAPMNSFWIPKLGGQVYAMTGMTTKLHLISQEKGMYDGVSANISGEGFAGMKFKAEATTEEDFELWIADSSKSNYVLDFAAYEQLAQPSRDNPRAVYRAADSSLYAKIIDKYMENSHDSPPRRIPGVMNADDGAHGH